MRKDYCTLNNENCNTKVNKIIIILLIFICGCEITQENIQSDFQNNRRNPKCEDVKSFKVFQVLDKFVLAFTCSNDSDLCLGHVAYFQKEKDKIYYDDQMIKVNDNECAIYTGTYQYQTKEGYKTVPIVKIIDSQLTDSK